MAILVFCSKCNHYISRKNKNCHRCHKDLRNVNKFCVNLPLPNGKRIVRVVDKNLTTARNVEAKIKSEIKQEKLFGVKKAPLIKDIWEKLHKWNQRNLKDSATVASRWYVHIEPYIASNLRMDQLRPYDITKILDRMKEAGGRNGDGCKPATIDHVLRLIKRLYNWAWQNDLYNGENPAAKIKIPKYDNQTTRRLTESETKRLLDVLKTWKNQTAALIIKFALYTGCRRSEIFKLTWKDVDFENRFIKLRDPKGKPTDLPIGQKVCDVLIESQKLNPKSKYAFPNRFGKKREHFGATWRRIKQRAQLPKEFRFHDLRHTFASVLISSGEVDLYRLQNLLNHQSASMTQRYAHLADEALRKAAESVDKVFD